MLTLYTAVGTLKFQKTTGGKSMNSRMPIPCARYRKKVRKAYPSNTI